MKTMFFTKICIYDKFLHHHINSDICIKNHYDFELFFKEDIEYLIIL